MTAWNDPLYKEVAAHLPKGSKAGDIITSLSITATKPRKKSGCC